MKNIKKYWIHKRNYFVEMAEGTKESQSVSFKLLDIYDKLSESEKLIVNDSLADWLISDDNTLRYDASFLISQRNIKSLKNAVEHAIQVSRRRGGPEAADEVEDLERILNELEV